MRSRTVVEALLRIAASSRENKSEMATDANTKIKGDLKVVAKVKVKYESRAAEIEVKGK